MGKKNDVVISAVDIRRWMDERWACEEATAFVDRAIKRGAVDFDGLFDAFELDKPRSVKFGEDFFTRRGWIGWVTYNVGAESPPSFCLCDECSSKKRKLARHLRQLMDLRGKIREAFVTP